MTSANAAVPAVTPAPDADHATKHLIALIDQLIAVVVDENAILARGLPASLSMLAKRKNELADELDLWVKLVAARRINIRSCDSIMWDVFVERLRALRSAMDENLERLRAAMDASRRRIDAIMQAIRQEMIVAASYGADGRVSDHPKAGQSACGISVQA